MTPFRKLVFIFLFLTTFFYQNGFTQSKDFASKEKSFANLYSKLLSYVQVDEDSTFLYSDNFSEEFKNFIKSNPITITYPFKKLIDSNYCQIRTSSDGNFRIYSWDTWTGGSMHEFNEIYQWRANGNVFAKVATHSKNNPGSFCSKIFTVSINGKTNYLAVTNAIYLTKDARQSISAFAVENNKLMDTVKLFRTKTKRLNRIDVGFDFFSVVDRPERPLELITYDDKLKIIYVPVVSDEGQVTKRNILYQLKDKQFEFLGIETGTRK
jgi:hypothetical protein